MLTNRGYLHFNHMGDLILFPMKSQINEYSMSNIRYFVEVVIIAGAHIKMDTSKENLINFQIKDGKSFILNHVQRLFYTPTSMIPS